MTGRPRSPGGDDGGDPPRRDGPDGFSSPDVGSVRRAHEALAAKARSGRLTGGGGSGERTPHPDDARLDAAMRLYERLGDDPPEINVARNDHVYKELGAHTEARHSPDIPLRGRSDEKTIEGRIHGGEGWDERAENWSLRWTDHTTMNREINDYIRAHWADIRTDLAFEGTHSGAFNAGHRVGEGFYNKGMYGVGPRQAEYTAASLVRVTIDLVPGSDPPQPFLVTAFPAGVVPFGLL